MFVDKFNTQSIKHNIILTPARVDNHFINCPISSKIRNIKKFFYHISPDKYFYSTGFFHQNNPHAKLLCPDISTHNKINSGLATIDFKFIYDHNPESFVLHFSFDIHNELFMLNKNLIIHSNKSWISAEQYKIFLTNENTSEALLSPCMSSKKIRNAIN